MTHTRVVTRDWAAELRRYRRLTDPEADRAIARYRAARPELTDLRDLVRSVVADLARAKSEGDPSLCSELDLAPDLPAWARDWRLLRRGQDVFNDRGIEMSTALCLAGLPIAYAAVSGAEALVRTSDLATANLTRRIGETGQMLIDVMGMRGADAAQATNLDPGTRGYATAVGLRLLHACVRSLLADPPAGSGGQPWPVDELGPPLNQEIMLATLMDFTAVTWFALGRMGVDLDEDARLAHLYTWSIVGHLMGVEACRERPLLLDDLDQLSPLLSRHLRATPAGRRLMDGLLVELERFMPLGWRKLPRSLVHWMFEGAPHGTDQVPRLLGVPRAAWWSGPLFRLLEASHSSPLLAPVRPPLDWVTRRAGRLIVVAFTDGLAPGAPPFEVPEPLARSWHLHRGRVPRRVRHARLTVRTSVRRVVPVGAAAARVNRRHSSRVHTGGAR